MPIVDRDLFTTDSGWTEDPHPPSSGSYAVSGGKGTYTPGGGGLDTNTAYRTAGTATVAAGYTFQESFVCTSATNNNWMIGVVNAPGAAFQGTYSAYVDNGAKRLFAWDTSAARNGNVSGAINITENTTQTFFFIITAGGLCDMYLNATHVDTSVTFSGLLGDTIYFERGNMDASDGVLNVDNYIATDGTYTPQTPTIGTATATSQTTATVTWTDVATTISADSIRIERSETSGSGFAEVGSANIGVETFDDTGLTAGTTYYYRVRARVSVVDYSGTTAYNSSYSSEASVTTNSADTGGDGEAMLVMGEL